jgi:hypothetical protein
VLPEVAHAIGRLKTALDNLALAATNNTAILQQLTVTNLALMTTVTILTATNKKLVDAVASAKRGGDSGGDSDNSGKRGTVHADPVPRQLLLDAWALMQQTQHQYHLWQQGCGPLQ